MTSDHKPEEVLAGVPLEDSLAVVLTAADQWCIVITAQGVKGRAAAGATRIHMERVRDWAYKSMGMVLPELTEDPPDLTVDIAALIDAALSDAARVENLGGRPDLYMPTRAAAARVRAFMDYLQID